MFRLGEPKLRPLSPALRAWAEAIFQRVSPSRLRAEVESLPAPRNRLHSPEAMTRADELIIQSFSDAGWATERRPFEFKNVLGFLDYADAGFPAGGRPKIYRHLAGTNLLAIKEGLSSTDALIIGAHHDTLRDSPGADDNTASVAALIELARVLAPYSFHHTIILAAFDMEEINFFGSTALVPQLAQERNIKGAVIFETMAYTSDKPHSQTLPPQIGLLYPKQVRRIKQRKFVGDWAVVVYRKSAASLAQAFAQGLALTAGADKSILIRDPKDLPLGRLFSFLIPSVEEFSRSDHVIFWEAGIPAIMISDTADFRNPNYHKSTDTPDTLDYEHLAAIIGATAVTCAQIAGLIENMPSDAMDGTTPTEHPEG
jgi:hypothetical protein